MLCTCNIVGLGTCNISVVTVVFIHTMEDDQRLITLGHEGDILHFHFSTVIKKLLVQ